MRYKQLVLAFIIFLSCASVYGQELAATVNVQTSKIENQIDTKIFTQFQKQLKSQLWRVVQLLTINKLLCLKTLKRESRMH